MYGKRAGTKNAYTAAETRPWRSEYTMQVSEERRCGPVRVLLADDHPLVRRGLRTILAARSEFEICAEATTGREAIEKAKAASPEVVLLDVSMPDMNGLEATRTLRKMLPCTEVLILTQHDSEAMISEALRAGAYGYMLKSDALADLTTAVECVSRHRPFFTSRVWKLILDRYLQDTPRGPESNRVLSAREVKMVRSLAAGNSNKEIAGAEGMSVKTVERWRARIMKKLGLASLCDIVHYAVRNEIIPA
jgi:DNA-binding NarL/FixJ family response regulator